MWEGGRFIDCAQQMGHEFARISDVHAREMLLAEYALHEEERKVLAARAAAAAAAGLLACYRINFKVAVSMAGLPLHSPFC